MSIFRVVPKVQPEVITKTIRQLLDDMNLIYIDSDLMQRLFDAWKHDRVDDWLLSILDGSGLATPFVQAKVSKVLEWLENELKSNPKNESLLQSIEVFQGIHNKGKEWVLLDGQHRYNYLGCWIRPKNEDERHVPNRKELDEIFARLIEDTDKLDLEKISGERFCDLPDQIQEDILSTEFFVVVYKSGDLRLIQQVFRVVNSSEKPRNMEVYMISLSPVVEFLRNVMNPTATSGSPHIRTFYEAALSGERNPDRKIGHKGAQLQIARFLGFLSRDKYSNWHDWQDTQKICDYDSEVTPSTMKHMVNILNEVSEAFLTYHNHLTGAKITPIRFIEKQSSNWSNIYNVFMFYDNLHKGKYKHLSDLGKYARIEDKSQFVEEVYRMIQTITSETDFIYVDRNGRNTLNLNEAAWKNVGGVNKPIIAEMDITIDGKTMTKQMTNPHGFRGHNEVNKTKQFNLRNDMMEKYFNTNADDWVSRGIIKLLDKQRGASAKKSQFNGVVVQNYTDANTGKKFTPYQLATKDNLVDSHFGENYIDGGTETLIGNKQVNAKMGTKKMQPKLEGEK